MTKQMQTDERAADTASDARWQAVIARDEAADGTFFYSVTTTGVYCRPSCGARRARPEHVRFFSTAEAAEQAGFRACKRCRPAGLSLTEATAARIAKVCRLIDRSDDLPALDRLAAAAGMSAFHFHRTFKATTGLTPADYAEAARSERMRNALTKSESVTAAIYDAGFNTGSRFYESADGVLGMTPTSFLNGGAKATIHFAIAECSLGSVLVARTERGVCAVLMGDDPQLLIRDVQDRFPRAEMVGNATGFEDVVAQVIGMIEQPGLGANLPLDIRGTAFQARVWKALQQIPLGATVTYTDLAKAIGMPKAARAVAQACGANPLAVAVPCHRVIRYDGAISGYRWGVERKRTLLDREARAANRD